LNDYPGPGADDNVTVTGNTIFGTSVYDAIDACSNNNTITGNTVVNSANSGLHLDGLCGGTGTGNTVNKNTFVESACAGILYDSDTAPDVGTDIYYAVPFPLADATSAASCVNSNDNGPMRHNKPMPSPKR
jgi:parallel beta-helix repeat protein